MKRNLEKAYAQIYHVGIVFPLGCVSVADNGDSLSFEAAKKHQFRKALGQKRFTTGHGYIADFRNLEDPRQCFLGQFVGVQLGVFATRPLVDVVAITAIQIAVRGGFEDQERNFRFHKYLTVSKSQGELSRRIFGVFVQGA